MASWLTEEDLIFFIAVFKRTGFSGGLNYYRPDDRNWSHTAYRRGEGRGRGMGGGVPVSRNSAPDLGITNRKLAAGRSWGIIGDTDRRPRRAIALRVRSWRCRYLVLTSSLRATKCTPSLLLELSFPEHCMPAYFPVPEVQALVAKVVMGGPRPLGQELEEQQVYP
jgi:hypothetical protein